jgi:hypothetical protein
MPALSGCFLPLLPLAVAGSAIGGKPYFHNSLLISSMSSGSAEAVSAAGICIHGLETWLFSSVVLFKTSAKLHTNSVAVSDGLPDWVISMLEIIGHGKGIAQALYLIPGTKMQCEKWQLFGDGLSDCSLLSEFEM